MTHWYENIMLGTIYTLPKQSYGDFQDNFVCSIDTNKPLNIHEQLALLQSNQIYQPELANTINGIMDSIADISHRQPQIN